MNQPLYMVRAELDARSLIRFAQCQGLNHGHDEDLGYAVHAWLAACFGPLAPKPFRIYPSDGQGTRLLGYCGQTRDELAAYATGQATPEAREVLRWETLAHARLPEACPEGRQLAFELLMCPISRQQQAEKDVFLRQLEQLAPETPRPDRGAVYRDWMARQLDGSAELLDFSLDGFHLVRVVRRTQRTSAGQARTAPPIIRPRALCRGLLTIRDSTRFHELLRRGIGRHRAFGYGMLLLSPAR